jgi:hypothetical protein
VDDCISSPLVWGGGEPAGFDNIIMQVSTDSLGVITSWRAYYTEEYRIGFGGVPAGYDNSSTMGTFGSGDDNVVIAGCDSGVPNHVLPDNSTFNDKIAHCPTTIRGKFVQCVSKLTNEWRRAGLVTGAQKGAIMRCAPDGG